MSIIKDVQSGALPKEEIPGFVAWAFRKLAWFFLAIIAAGFILVNL